MFRRQLFVLWALLASPAWAQPEAETPVALSGSITEIQVRAPPSENADDLIALSGLRVGQVLAGPEIRRAVKLLYQVGRFENIYVRAAATSQGVAITLEFLPRRTVRDLRLIDGGVLGHSDVLRVIGVELGDAFAPEDFAVWRRKLRRVYASRGFRSAAIGVGAPTVSEDGSADVVIRVDAGPVTRVREVSFSGVLVLAKPLLAREFSMASEDVMDAAEIDAAAERLRALYRRRGHYAPEVTTTIGAPLDGSDFADLDVHIVAGPKLRVEFHGRRVIPARLLRGLESHLLEDPTEDRQAQVREELIDLMLWRGHDRAEVAVERRMSADGRSESVVFRLVPGRRVRIGSVEFPGNTALEAETLQARLEQLVEETRRQKEDEILVDWRTAGDLLGRGGQEAARGDPEVNELSADELYLPRAFEAAPSAFQDLYQASGYHSVVVSPPRLVMTTNGRSAKVIFQIDQGPRWRIDPLRVTDSKTFDEAELLGLVELRSQEPLRFYDIDAARREIRRHYQKAGYYFAQLDVFLAVPKRIDGFERSGVRRYCAAIQETGDPHCDVEVQLVVTEGPQVQVGRVLIRGATGTHRALIQQEISIREGEILSLTDVLDTQTNLSRLGVFRRVHVAPLDERTVAAQKDVVIELVEKQHSSFEVGTGVSTAQGVRLFAEYGHGHLFGTGLRARINAQLNYQIFLSLFNQAVRDFLSQRPIEYDLGGGLSLPRVIGLPRGFGFSLDISALHDNEAAFSEESQQIALTANYDGFQPVFFGRKRPLGLRLRTSIDRSSVLCNQEGLEGAQLECGASAQDPTRRESELTFYVGIEPSVSWDFRDDALDPRAGAYLEVRPQFFFGLNDDSPDHFRIETKLNGYIPLFEDVRLALSLVFWRIWPLELGGRDLPVNRRLFAGGRSTIRGFREQTLFPVDALGGATEVSPGGLLFLALKSELRFPIYGALDGALFHDVGDLFADPGETFAIDRITRQSVGFGIRYSTPIGPLLLDIAFTRRNGKIEWEPHLAAVGSF